MPNSPPMPWQAVVEAFKAIFYRHAKMEFPQDPYEQLKLATEAVFKSWNGKRAMDYRNAAGIAHDLGTAVNIVTMVFGNMGDDSATGVAMTRNGSTGEKMIEGDYLTNAQGEDVVAGIRMTKTSPRTEKKCPRLPGVEDIAERWKSTTATCRTWSSPSRRASSGCCRPATASAPPRRPCASPWTWPRRASSARKKPCCGSPRIRWTSSCTPSSDLESAQAAREMGQMLATGLNVSPGAAVGVVAFDADLAEAWAKNEGKAGDHGAAGNQAGRRPRHAGRQGHSDQPRRPHQPRRPGGPAVRQTGRGGVSPAQDRHGQTPDDHRQHDHPEGDWLSIDGTIGEIYRAS
jgi:pyruvate,orthophosphate dikinase